MTEDQTQLLPIEVIQSKIVVIRDEKVMIDKDLAQLYGVETKQLKRAVRRNRHRFPPDFMFELTREEYNSLRSQFGTLKRGAYSKYLPMAFTEQGVAMLSSVLTSSRAIDVNVAIIRAFVQLRKISSSQKQLAKKLQEIEARLALKPRNQRLSMGKRKNKKTLRALRVLRGENGRFLKNLCSCAGILACLPDGFLAGFLKTRAGFYAFSLS